MQALADSGVLWILVFTALGWQWPLSQARSSSLIARLAPMLSEAHGHLRR